MQINGSQVSTLFVQPKTEQYQVDRPAVVIDSTAAKETESSPRQPSLTANVNSEQQSRFVRTFAQQAESFNSDAKQNNVSPAIKHYQQIERLTIDVNPRYIDEVV